MGKIKFAVRAGVMIAALVLAAVGFGIANRYIHAAQVALDVSASMDVMRGRASTVSGMAVHEITIETARAVRLLLGVVLVLGFVWVISRIICYLTGNKQWFNTFCNGGKK